MKAVRTMRTRQPTAMRAHIHQLSPSSRDGLLVTPGRARRGGEDNQGHIQGTTNKQTNKQEEDAQSLQVGALLSFSEGTGFAGVVAAPESETGVRNRCGSSADVRQKSATHL